MRRCAVLFLVEVKGHLGHRGSNTENLAISTISQGIKLGSNLYLVYMWIPYGGENTLIFGGDQRSSGGQL